MTIQVNSLVDMGFEKTQVEAAVKAANGRIDLAVEYLNNGIPDNINNNRNNVMRRNKVESDITKELKKTAGVIKMLCKDNKFEIFRILNNIKKNDPGLLRLITDYRNEFKNYLNEPITDEDRKNFENIENRANIIEKDREEKERKEKEEKEKKEKEEKEKEEGKEEKEEKEKLEPNGEIQNNENKTEINEIKEDENKKVINENEKGEKEKPTEEVNQNTDKSNENNKEKKDEKTDEKVEKKDIEEENKTEEKKEGKVNENKEKEQTIKIDNNSNSHNNISEQLNEEDKVVVNRIKSLVNFSLDTVIEAYIVCNKNEELTLNYLFEQHM